MKDEQLENLIVTLYHNRGWSIRKLSRELGASRKRIRRVLVSKRVLRDTTPQDKINTKKRRTSKLDPYKKYIGELLEKYPDYGALKAEVLFLLAEITAGEGDLGKALSYLEEALVLEPNNRIVEGAIRKIKSLD